VSSSIRGVDKTATIYGPAFGTLGPMYLSSKKFTNWLQNSFTITSNSPYFIYTPLPNMLVDILSYVDVFTYHAYRLGNYANNWPELGVGGPVGQSYLDEIQALKVHLRTAKGSACYLR